MQSAGYLPENPQLHVKVYTSGGFHALDWLGKCTGKLRSRRLHCPC